MGLICYVTPFYLRQPDEKSNILLCQIPNKVIAISNSFISYIHNCGKHNIDPCFGKHRGHTCHSGCSSPTSHPACCCQTVRHKLSTGMSLITCFLSFSRLHFFLWNERSSHSTAGGSFLLRGFRFKSIIYRGVG